MEPRRRPARARSLGAPAPCSPATSPAQYPAGSGVGVTVLLRQPHGFEGLLPLLVETDARDAPVADRPHPGSASLGFDPVATLDVNGDGRHHVLASFDELVCLDATGLPRANELVEEPSRLIEAVNGPPRTDRPG